MVAMPYNDASAWGVSKEYAEKRGYKYGYSKALSRYHAPGMNQHLMPQHAAQIGTYGHAICRCVLAIGSVT